MCPLSQVRPLLSSCQLLPMWEHRPSVARIFFFLREAGNQDIYGKSPNFRVLVVYVKYIKKKPTKKQLPGQALCGSPTCNQRCSGHASISLKSSAVFWHPSPPADSLSFLYDEILKGFPMCLIRNPLQPCWSLDVETGSLDLTFAVLYVYGPTPAFWHLQLPTLNLTPLILSLSLRLKI